jgi:hypothetical protein
VSNINSNIINENFPIAGQDNDTQTFRDNFSAIKDNFAAAKTEIEDLQDNSARTDQDTNFNNNIISFSVLENVREKFVFLGGALVESPQEISLTAGSYHAFGVNGPISLNFTDFPSELDVKKSVGRVTLEITATAGAPKIITLLEEGGIVFKKNGFDVSGEPLIKVNFFSGNTFTVPAGKTVILEVWKYDSTTIFIKYIGTFE